MVNQQLLDFIKEQIQKGLAKEIISQELLGNGWTIGDIEEGFGKINVTTPTPTPTPASVQPQVFNQNQNLISNQTLVSNFGSINPINPINNTSDVFIKEKSHSGKKIFLIVLVLFLIAGGVSAYYFRNELVKLPVIKDIFPNTNVVVNEIIPEQNLPIQISGTTQPISPEQNQVAQTITDKTITDCGISYPDKLKDLVFTDTNGGTTKVKDYDKDPAIVCMGNALLNNCQKAIIKVQSKNGTVHTEEIVGTNNVGCTFKVTYQDVNVADADQKQYENSYLQCDYPSSDPRIEFKNGCSGFIPLSNAACNFFGIKNSSAHVYINSIGKMMLGALFSPNEIKCSGDMIGKITKASTVVSTQSSNPNCSLKLSAMGLSPVPEFSIGKGVSVSVTALGFKGLGSNVSWAIKDKVIATVSSSTGKTVKIKANSLGLGSTQLIITDNSIPNCSISVPVSIISTTTN